MWIIFIILFFQEKLIKKEMVELGQPYFNRLSKFKKAIMGPVERKNYVNNIHYTIVPGEIKAKRYR